MATRRIINAITGEETTEEYTPVEPPIAEQIRIARENITSQIAESDAFMARVTEDIINVLIAKGAIAMTDLPQEVQDKLADRQNLRNQLNAL